MWPMGRGPRPWAKAHGHGPGPGPGPLGVARRADGGPDNGRAAEWAHGGPRPWARAHGHGPGPMGQGYMGVSNEQPPECSRVCLFNLLGKKNVCRGKLMLVLNRSFPCRQLREVDLTDLCRVSRSPKCSFPTFLTASLRPLRYNHIFEESTSQVVG